MANEEVLGPRKTMFVLVIVVGCFAVLWPRILSPLILGSNRDQLKPNQFDRDTGCCEVIFDKDMVIMELLNEVCSFVTHTEKLSPYSAAECRKTVNETCGVDIAAYLKRSDNVGKTSKMLIETMKNSNSSCLREHFGVPVWSLGSHLIQNSWTQQDTLKQERPPIRGAGPHPALRERGRAIPAGVPTPPTRGSVTMPPHARPPPIPGMRPPLGSPGGPVPAPKSSMGFVMPIYTICIIVFFVYTLSKILFKRTGTSPYESITPDPQFRRRVFRDNSRTSPDKLVVTAISGLVAEVQQQMEASYAQNQQWQDVQQDDHTRPYTNGKILHNSSPVHIVTSEYQEVVKEKASDQKDRDISVPETITEVEETVPLEVEKPKSTSEVDKIESTPEVEAPVEVKLDELTDSPVKDIQYIKEPSPEPVLEKEQEITVETDFAEVKVDGFNESPVKDTQNIKETSPEAVLKEEQEPAVETYSEEVYGLTESPVKDTQNVKEPSSPTEENVKDSIPKPEVAEPEMKAEEETDEKYLVDEIVNEENEKELESVKSKETDKSSEKSEITEVNEVTDILARVGYDAKNEENSDTRKTEEFLKEEMNALVDETKEKQSTPELLEDAIKDEEEVNDNEKSSVKVVGMEMTAHLADGSACVTTPPAATSPRPLAVAAPSPRAHEAESVQSIFLETEIPQQSRVLVADFAEDRADKPQPTKHSPMVVSGKMTLSLIQDAPRDTPERDQESTLDDFTTASAVTQNAAEKEGEESDEEIEEEIEIEEIEEEVEEEEEEAELKPKVSDKK